MMATAVTAKLFAGTTHADRAETAGHRIPNDEGECARGEDGASALFETCPSYRTRAQGRGEPR